MIPRKVSIIAAAGLLVTNLLYAQEAPRVSFKPLECIPKACRGPLVEAKALTTDVAAMRVYFHSDVDATEYYVDMRPGDHAGEYWAVLPLVADGTKNVTYYVAAVDPAGRLYGSDPVTVPVSDRCHAPDLTREQERYARNLVLGLKEPGEAAIPPGFRCWGIVSKITASGDLLPHEECRQVVVKNREHDPCAIPLPIAAALVAGQVGAGIGIAIIDQHNPEKPPTPISPARP